MILKKTKNILKIELLWESTTNRERNKKFVGEKIPCIIECYSDNGEIIARTPYDAPEIDGVVNIKTDKFIVPGDIELVKIIGATEYDLIGEL